ncbi:NUDIX hydrolase [Colwellia psychrerythraea]|uniref:NUDIX hydrolase n=1 Tax=Colwellia psychrerythraea TaxID=28229 RepID=UPI000AEA171C|nr:NUDIX hydrolase [Colwellia psychrerythraea]
MSSNSKNALGSNEQVKNDHGEKQFKPNTTVAAVIHHQGKFLFVEEIDNNHVVYNQPAGHLEADESLITAIKREVLEETGLALVPDYLCGIYYFHRPDLNLYFLRFCFVIELEQWLKGQPQDNEIIDTHWFSFEQIKLKRHQLRSAMVLECIEDYLAGNKIPLSQLKSNL